MPVWNCVEWDDPYELCYTEREQGELITDIAGKRAEPFTAFVPKFDDGTGEAVADAYRLGDVLFFKSIGPARLTHTGSSEIYLGNEGFYGSIYEQAAVIATL